MHNSAFKALGVNAYYLFLETAPDGFRRLLREKKRLPLSGFNLTVPHKEMVLPFLDKTSPEVRLIGACNTVRINGSRWEGHNTDAYGFLKGLEEKKFHPKGKDVIVIGAGGAARAVIFVLLSQGVKSLVVLNRTLSKAEKLVRGFSSRFPDSLYGAARLDPENIRTFLPGKHLIVNTTSVGLKAGEGSPVSSKDFPRVTGRVLAYDLIYGPRTSFLKIAQAKGCRTQDGLAMLLHQGAKAFEIWTGKKAPGGVMRKALRKQ